MNSKGSKNFDLNFNVITPAFIDAFWYHLLTSKHEKVLFLLKKVYDSKMLLNLDSLPEQDSKFLMSALKLRLLGYSKDAIFEQLALTDDSEWKKRFDVYASNKLDILDPDIFAKLLEDKIKKFETYNYVSNLFNILLTNSNTDYKLEQIKSQIKEYQAKTDYDVEFKQLKLEDFNRLYEEKAHASNIKISWPSFSKIYENGFESGRLYVVGGASGRGKSAFLTNLGIEFLKQNKVVYHLTLENSISETMIRYLSNIASVKISSVLDNKEIVSQELDKFLFTNKGKLYVKEYPVYTLSKSDIMNYVKTLLTTDNVYPDVIIVDYLDLLTTYDKFNEVRFKLTQIANDLKSLAQMLNCVVITATQLNRESLRILTADEANSSESYGKIQVADSLLTLNAINNEIKEGLIRLFVAKNRNGPARKEFLFKVDFSKMTFTDLNTEITEEYKKRLESKGASPQSEDTSFEPLDLNDTDL